MNYYLFKSKIERYRYEYQRKDKHNNNLLLKKILNYKTISFAIGVILFSNLIIYQNSEAIEETTNTNNNYPLSKLFDQVQQSVVQISSSDENISQQLGFRLGSGFVYDKNGHIITNNHVVSGSDELLVTFPDGSIYIKAN